MTELIERYIHQVGRYLPPKERAEIEAELRSQIEDQLEDRYSSSRSVADEAAVLAEFGSPRRMAASYGSAQYLIGPELYPSLMMVLRRGWLIVPVVVVFLSLFGALVSDEQPALLAVLLGTVGAAVQAIFLFSAVVVMIFAIVQHSGLDLSGKAETFDPLELPQLNDPAMVDRNEGIFGGITGMLVALIYTFFLSVGGLTLKLNPTGLNDLIPVPAWWMILFIILTLAMVVLAVIVLRRNRWNVSLWVTQSALEAAGVICLYYVLYKPIFERLTLTVPAFANLPFAESAPEIIAVLTAIGTLVGRGNRLVTLMKYQNSTVHPPA